MARSLCCSMYALAIVAVLLTACGDRQAQDDCPCGAVYQCCEDNTYCVPDASSCSNPSPRDMLGGSVWMSGSTGSASFVSLYYVAHDGTCGWHISSNNNKNWTKRVVRWQFSQIKGTVDDMATVKIVNTDPKDQWQAVEFQLQRQDPQTDTCGGLSSTISSKMPCYLWCAPGSTCDGTKGGTAFVKCGLDPTEANACGVVSGITPLIK